MNNIAQEKYKALLYEIRSSNSPELENSFLDYSIEVEKEVRALQLANEQLRIHGMIQFGTSLDRCEQRIKELKLLTEDARATTLSSMDLMIKDVDELLSNLRARVEEKEKEMIGDKYFDDILADIDPDVIKNMLDVVLKIFPNIKQ